MNALDKSLAALDTEMLRFPMPGHLPRPDTATISWPKPRPVECELPAVFPFAESLLPTALSDFVLDEAARMPCAPDYIAAALVVAIGSLIGASCAVKPKRRDDSWLVPANLWGGVVGEPSSKKTPAIGLAMKPLDRLEAQEAAKFKQSEAEYLAELAAFKAFESAIQAEMKKAVSSKGAPRDKDDRLAAAKHDLSTLRPPDMPHQRRFKTNDCTVEKLGDMLVHNPVGLLVLRDELTGLLASWDKEGREGDRAFYLEGWNGTGSFNIDRISRGSLFVPNLCLSVFGGIQPELLERYLSDMSNSLDNDGRMQRFQVLVFPDPTPWAWRDRRAAEEPRARIRTLFERLADFDPVAAGASPANEYVALPHFSFDDNAQETFIEWSHALHERIQKEGNPLVRQHLAKYEKLFCALCLIFHLAEGKTGDIDAGTALHAVAYCTYLESHARRVYSLLESARVTAAQTLSRKLAEGKLADGFTVRDVRRKRWSGLGSAPQVEAALDMLEEFEWLQGMEMQAGAMGGRPTTTYWINPQVPKMSCVSKANSQ